MDFTQITFDGREIPNHIRTPLPVFPPPQPCSRCGARYCRCFESKTNIAIYYALYHHCNNKR